MLAPLFRPDDMEFLFHGLIAGEPGENGGDFDGNARPHDDQINSGEDRPINRRQQWRLNLVQIVDAHFAPVPFLG